MPKSQENGEHDRRGAWARRHNHALVSLARRVWERDCTLDSAFALISQVAADTLEVERVNIWRYDAAAGTLTCVHNYLRSSDQHNPPGSAMTLAIGSEYQHAMDDVRVIDISDQAQIDSDPALSAYLKINHIDSLLDAPVRSAGELLGVVCHEHVGASRVWTPEDQAFAASIGDYVAMAYEISRRREAEGRLRYLELHDPHTDLPNRDHLLEVVHSALRPMADNGCDLVAIHLHIDAAPLQGDAGHDLLVQAANRLRADLGSVATLARVRGNALAVLPHEHLHETRALALAERCVEVLQQGFEEQGAQVMVTGGLAFSHDLTAPSADNLLRNAEMASQNAIRGRHNRCEVFNADHHRGLVARLKLERALREAFAAGRLQVHYQPEVDLTDGCWLAAEALLRWVDTDGTCHPAKDFIAVAEDSGLIVPFGRWALAQACRDAMTWPDNESGAAPRLRVNVSARQFEQAGLVTDVAAALAESGLPPARLCLELTETSLLPDFDLAVTILAKLRALGVRIALDDFGVGYSSLAYLKRLPIDTVKLDQTFIAGLPDDPYDLAIVQAVAGLAAKTGIDIVAEGVESEQQARTLRDCGVERGQGFLFSGALPAEAIRAGFAARPGARRRA